MQITFLRNYIFQENNLAVNIIPKHIWEPIAPEDMKDQAAAWAISDPNKLMGSGPYYLEEYDDTNEVIHLTVNSYYENWTEITPNFDDIYFECYSNKDSVLADLAAGVIDMVDAQYIVQIDEVPSGCGYTLIDTPGVNELAFNCLNPYFGTGEFCAISGPASARHIRKAISLMIPRDAIVNELFNGLARPGITACPRVAIGFDESLEPYPYSMELAIEHMEAAGFSGGFPTIPLTPNTPIEIQIPFYIIIGSFIISSIMLYFLKKRKVKTIRK